MRLTELSPRWFDVAGTDSERDGVTFFCPCAACSAAIVAGGSPARLAAQFANPIDGAAKPPMRFDEKHRHVHDLHTFDVPPGFLWQRTGDTFETLSLSPSIDASASGHWHGFVTNGEVR